MSMSDDLRLLILFGPAVGILLIHSVLLLWVGVAQYRRKD